MPPWFLIVSACLFSTLAAGPAATARPAPQIDVRAPSPAVDFAVGHLEAALSDAAARYTFRVALDPAALPPQAYTIQRQGPVVSVVGGDRLGAMYGVLELAERLSFSPDPAHLPPIEHAPFIEQRGIKFNIPLDARLPSYDDTGDAAQHNIAQVWDRGFWHAYLDDLAKNRYNVLSLWCKHPFPAMIKLEDYPDVAMDDVYAFGPPRTREMHKDFLGFDLQDPKNHVLVKRMTLDEKIAHWQHVMQYAHDRGIAVYFFTWNIYVIGAEKYGINDWSESAVGYMRQCVRVFAETYPHLAGIGVTAGEHMGQTVGERTNVQWLFDTYGQGVADVLRASPGRDLRFIFRANSITLDDVHTHFRSKYPGRVDTSFKYSGPHMYTTPEPRAFAAGFGQDVARLGYQSWMNLRNDDFYVYRWGDPDFARAYLKKLATYPTAGFYIGSDGYVWGREFISKVPELAGQLENEKHWYREMIWGRLAFDPTLDTAFFAQRLAQRFPGIDAPALFAAWQTASQILPSVNRIYWKGADSQFQAEGCASYLGFVSVRTLMDGSVHDRDTMLSIVDYGKALQAGGPLKRITPFEAADALVRRGNDTLGQVAALRAGLSSSSPELEDTLSDLEAMAWMGRYYGQKLRGATHLYLYETLDDKADHHARSVAALRRAEHCWGQYAAHSAPRYRPQLLARTDHLDWEARVDDVRRDTQIAEASTGQAPRIIKLFCYSRHAPEAVESLKTALTQRGYVPQVHPAWQRNSFANYTAAVLAARVGEKIHKKFLRSGGVVPESLEQDGYAFLQDDRFLWVFGQDEAGVQQGLKELTRLINAGETVFGEGH